MEPVGRDRGHRVQRGAEGFRHEFEPVEHPDRREHMRRVGALWPTGLEPPHGAASLPQLVEEDLFGAPRQQAVPKFAQHRKVESRIRQLETQQILPVDARADRLRRLAIRQMLPKLPNRHQRQPPRGQGWLAPRREQGGKVLVLKDGPEYITERERGMACGKGRMGHTGGFVRHRLDDVRVERHERRPSAAWGTAPPISGAVLCHSPLPRGTQQVRTRSASIFHYRNSFL